MFFCKVSRYFNGNSYILVASSLGVKVLYTLSLELEDISRLCSRMYLIACFSVKSRNNDFMTESRLCKCKRYLAPYVISLALEYLMLFNVYIYMKIAGRTSVVAAVSMTAYIAYDILTDACRKSNGDRAL